MADLMIPDIRENKLPAWVRGVLLELRNKVSEQANTLAIAREEARENGCTGKVMADGLARAGFPLHDRAMVTFQVPGGKVDVMLREHGTLLDINSSGRMLVLPNASNSIFIKIEERL